VSQANFVTYDIERLTKDLDASRIKLLLPNIGSSIEREIIVSHEPSLQRLHKVVVQHKTEYEVNTSRALDRMIDDPS
jgi:phosphohistidine phosphatase SixA